MNRDWRRDSEANTKKLEGKIGSKKKGRKNMKGKSIRTEVKVLISEERKLNKGKPQ